MYHSPGLDDTYLPDCNAPLNREYWRVFAVSESSAYVIPRMDAFGVANKYGMCTGETELSSLFKKYGLCKEVLGSADIQVLNNMEPAEALNITHALHKRLCFESQNTAGSWSIVPWAPDDDIHEVCNKNIDAGAASYCDEIMKRFNCNGTCIDMAMVPSAAAINVIVPGLNKLYGTQCTGLPSTARSQYDDSFASLLIIAVFVVLHQIPLHV